MVATDLDSGENGRITYSIKSSTGPGLFSINSDGDVTLQGSLNYETTESYTVVIMAEDNGVPKLSSTVELEIFVIDINEQPRISCVGSCVFTVSEGRDSLDLGYYRGILWIKRMADPTLVNFTGLTMPLCSECGLGSTFLMFTLYRRKQITRNYTCWPVNSKQLER